MLEPNPQRNACQRCGTISPGRFCSYACESSFKNEAAAECIDCRLAMGQAWATDDAMDVPNDARCKAHV